MVVPGAEPAVQHPAVRTLHPTRRLSGEHRRELTEREQRRARRAQRRRGEQLTHTEPSQVLNPDYD